MGLQVSVHTLVAHLVPLQLSLAPRDVLGADIADGVMVVIWRIHSTLGVAQLGGASSHVIG